MKVLPIILLLMLSSFPMPEVPSPPTLHQVIHPGVVIDLSSLYKGPTVDRRIYFTENPENATFAMKFGDGFIATRNGGNGLPDLPLQFYTFQQEYVRRAYRAFNLTGLDGEGVIIAVVDTGVDFSNPEISHSMAREEGRPLMLDADGQGIALTPVKVVANLVNGRLENFTEPKPPCVLVLKNGTYLYFGDGYEFDVYNPLFPFLGDVFLRAKVGGLWKIGNDTERTILSKSGIYRFGLLAEVQPIEHEGEEGLVLLMFPVLFVDDREAGVYETVYVDMSSTYWDLKNFLAGKEIKKLDYNFYDEKPHRIRDGTEIIAADFNNDGIPDITAGTLGTYVLDVWGAIGKRLKRTRLGPSYGKPLEPMDINGTYFTIMYDAIGHGTAVAGTIASKGEMVYNVTKEGLSIRGVAPGAKIIAVKALWVSDVLYAWLWLAGMDYVKGKWTYRESPRADIVVNSFGISSWPYLEGMPGKDVLSLLADIMDLPGSLYEGYKGMLMVVAAGNGGPGRGTITPPGSSTLALTVGASTAMDWTYMGDRLLWNGTRPARIGLYSTRYDDIAPWSARGPTIAGVPKPELVAMGMYGFAPSPVTIRQDGAQAYTLFGGTSMATPIVAGIAAGLLQGLRERGIEPDPLTLKEYLVASTKPLGYAPSEQGSGLLDFEKAFKGATKGWNLTAYAEVEPEVYRQLYEYTFRRLNISIPIEKLKRVKVTTLFFPFLEPGVKYEKRLVVNSKQDYEADAVTLKRVGRFTYKNVSLVNVYDPLLGEDGGWRPLYVKLDEVVPEGDYDLFRISLTFPRQSFYNESESYVYFEALSRLSLFIYEWKDVNGDGKVWYNETSLASFAAGWTNVQRASIKDRNLLLGIYETPKFADYWTGRLYGNVSRINFTLVVDTYRFVEDDNLALKKEGDMLKISVHAPNEPGVYEGFVRIRSGAEELWLPYLYEVAVKVDGFDNVASWPIRDVEVPPDASWRYESGDWAFYRVRTLDALNSLTFRPEARNGAGLALFVFDAYGKLISSNSYSGGLLKVYGWPSTDWLGPGGLGSGGFHPTYPDELQVKAKEDSLYTLVVHMTSSPGFMETPPRLFMTASYLPNDTSPPKVEFLQEPWTVITGMYTLNWTVISTAPYRAFYKLDFSPWRPAVYNFVELNVTKEKDGTHILSVMVQDAAGRSTTEIFPFVIDNTPPKIELKGFKDGDFVSGKLSFNITLDEAHPKFLTVRVGRNWYNTTEPHIEVFADVSSLEGPVNVFVLAEDELNHTSKAEFTFYVDNIPPSIRIEFPKNGTLVDEDTEIKFEIEEPNLKNFTVLVDGRLLEEYVIRPSRLADGIHVLEIEALDMAGHKSKLSVEFRTEYFASKYAQRTLYLLLGLGIAASVIIAMIRRRGR